MSRTFYEGRVLEEEADGVRVDRYISDFLHLFKRSQIKQRDVEVTLNGKTAKMSKPVRLNDTVVISYSEPGEPNVVAEHIPLDIVYENERVLVLNKPRGMVVHPAAGNYSGTMVQGLLYYVKQLRENFSDEAVRPGIVHRLDKDTSGIIVAAKDPEALQMLAAQFAHKKVRKVYLAVVKGHVRNSRGIIKHPIARDPHHRKRFTWRRAEGRTALTHYRVLRYLRNASLVELSPRTGRTHQLRVHMASLGHPVMGDPIYGRGGGTGNYRLLLHARRIKIRLPEEEKPRVFRAPLPGHFKKALNELRL